MEQATFAAGCFWGVEETFRTTKGVLRTSVGYTGGRTHNPTYEQVCEDNTGHAEAVQIEFDPKQVKYKQLLDIFWANHDPTQKNRQGPDVGTQYRSAIFYHNSEQKKIAEQSRKEEQKKRMGTVVTEIMPVAMFYRAEDYHQQYLAKRGQSHCHF